MDQLNKEVIEPLKAFSVDSLQLIRKCSKPDAKEYKKILWATLIGFAIMGVIGFVTKLVFIPINQRLVS